MECPAKMHDGRLVNDFKTATRRNEEIRFINGVSRDDMYRTILQENGKKILKRTKQHSKSLQCRPETCVHQYDSRVTAESMSDELRNYNKRASGKKGNNTCENFDFFKMTEY